MENNEKAVFDKLVELDEKITVVLGFLGRQGHIPPNQNHGVVYLSQTDRARFPVQIIEKVLRGIELSREQADQIKQIVEICVPPKT